MDNVFHKEIVERIRRLKKLAGVSVRRVVRPQRPNLETQARRLPGVKASLRLRLVEEDKECVICHDPICKGNMETVGSCHHWFHTSCIDIWLVESEDKHCFICRKSWA